MEAAGNLVGIGVELAAGVQHGHYNLGGGAPLFRMHVHRNAAAVVAHTNRAIVVDGDDHLVAIAGQGLVNGVVHHLENHVMQSGTVIGVTDVHTGPLADGFQAFKDFDAAGIVIVVHG